jgi:hypothetical protein
MVVLAVLGLGASSAISAPVKTHQLTVRHHLSKIGTSPFEIGAVTDGRRYAIFTTGANDFEELADSGQRRTIAPPVTPVLANSCSITAAGWGVAVSNSCGTTDYLLDLQSGKWRPLTYTFPADGGFGPVGRYWLVTTDCEFAPGNQTCPLAYYNWHNGRYIVASADQPEANIDSPTLSGTYAATHLEPQVRGSFPDKTTIGYRLPGKRAVTIATLPSNPYGLGATAGAVLWVDSAGVHAYVIDSKLRVNFPFVVPRAVLQSGVDLSATSRYVYLAVPRPNATMTRTGSVVYRGLITR